MRTIRTLALAAVLAGSTAFATVAAQAKDIVDTAVSAGSFKTLVAAVQAAGLVETLKGAGPFTVFAPTDEAFAKLPAGTVENLLKPENKAQLVAILTLPRGAGQGDVDRHRRQDHYRQDRAGRRTQHNATSGVKVNEATVTQADIVTDNGVIHVVDTVILPK